jgi:hypothetical protein
MANDIKPRICNPACWEPVRCEHGREMTPVGRSVPLERPNFCDCYQSGKNPRHLWSEHDDARWYSDPDGWAAHVATCEQCKGDPE